MDDGIQRELAREIDSGLVTARKCRRWLGNAVLARLIAWAGMTILCYVALLGSLWGWLPYLTGLPQAWFLSLTAVAALMFAALLTRP